MVCMSAQDKVAIITGASRGIGRAIGLRLAQSRVHCVLCARDADALNSVVQEMEGHGAMLAADLRLPESPKNLVDFAIEKFGRIDMVINNAGATKRGEFVELIDDDWQDGFALKFFAAVRLTREAWPYLKASSGSVVNISGTGGRTPGALFSIGGSVNAAHLSFTKALAETGIRDGVQVNAINPGMVRTARLQKRLEEFPNPATAEEELIAREKVTRIGEPIDIANLVAFIVSPQGRFLQGSLIDMDGGATKTI